MKKIFLFVFIAISIASYGQTTIYPLPASYSYRSVASFSQPRIIEVGQLPSTSIASPGDMVILATGTTRTLYRYATPSWLIVGGEGGLATDTSLVNILFSSPSSRTSSPTFWVDLASNSLKLKYEYVSGTSPVGISEFPLSTQDYQPYPTGHAIQSTGTARIVGYPSNGTSGFESWRAFDQNSSTYWKTAPSGDPNASKIEFWSGGYNSYIATSCPYFSYTRFAYFSAEFEPGFATPTYISLSRYGTSWSDEVVVASSSLNGVVGGVRYFFPISQALASGPWLYMSARFHHAGTTASDAIAVREIGIWEAVTSDITTTYIDTPVPAASEISVGVVSTSSQTLSGLKAFASGTAMLPSTATPTTPATGTLWMDGNLTPPKMKCFDGTAWNALW
jgi:hypothetical protein